MCIDDKDQEELLIELRGIVNPIEKNIFDQYDRSINGFPLPIRIETYDGYDKKIEEELTRFVKYIEGKFALRKIPGLLDNVRFVCRNIVRAIQEERCGNTKEAQDYILEILEKFKKDSFFVSDIDCSYAFRGSASVEEFRSKNHDYNQQASVPLSFYRCRKGKITDRVEMLHIPLTQRSKVGTSRFSLPGIPCLYLASTSYCCWNELDHPGEMSVAGFRLTEAGKKLKILNLVIPQSLINGSSALHTYEKLPSISQKMLTLFPIVMATSITVDPRKSCEYRPNYTISHLIMRCLKKLRIDGVAYLSAQSESEFEFPHCVNLALPVFSSSIEQKYGDICKSFEIAGPIYYDGEQKSDRFTSPREKSYINKVYVDGVHSTIKFNGKRTLYSETDFAEIDNILAGSQFYPILTE